MVNNPFHLVQPTTINIPNPFLAPVELAPPALQPVDVEQPSDPDAIKTPAELTIEYIDLRNAKKRLLDEQAEALRPFNDRMATIEAKMLARLDAAGVESMRTANGTAFKKVSTSYTVNDPEALFSWIEANGRLDMVARSIKQDTMREFAEEHKTLPPGVDTFARVAVQFRAAR
jgi:hypothetical protein